MMHKPISRDPLKFDEAMYDDLDPGIVEVVRFLHGHGFETTDSGDGVSKLDPDFKWHDPHCWTVPHVAVRTTLVSGFSDARKVQELLWSLDEDWYVEFTFIPSCDSVSIVCSKFRPEDVE